MTVPYMMSMTWPELRPWYDNYELQITEEEIINDLNYDKKTGKKRDLPSNIKIRSLVEKKIAERREKINAPTE